MKNIDHKRIRNLVYEVIEKGEYEDSLSRIFDIFFITLITLNVVSVFIETFSIPQRLVDALGVFEIVSVVIFSIEYLVRIWTAPEKFRNCRSGTARLKYIFSFMAMIDLLSIVPFYLPMIFTFDLRILWILKVFKLLRLFKFSRYIDALNYLLLVLKNKAIYFLSSFFILMILMIITSTLMYFVEHDAQPDVFENAFSGMWWSIVTFTTVGYGDLYPVTLAGKILGGIVSLLGIGLVAVPTGIITSGFMELHSADKEKLDEKSDLEKELAKLKEQISKVELILKESKGE